MHSGAVKVLQLLNEVAPLAEDVEREVTAASAAVAKANRWRLSAAVRVLCVGGLQSPWPLTLIELVGREDAGLVEGFCQVLRPRLAQHLFDVGSAVHVRIAHDHELHATANDVVTRRSWREATIRGVSWTPAAGREFEVDVACWGQATLPQSCVVSTQSSGGGALLRAAAAEGLAYLVDQLIAVGVSVYEADESCSTAIHSAAEAGHAALCRSLIAAGADCWVANKHNRWPTTLA